MSIQHLVTSVLQSLKCAKNKERWGTLKVAQEPIRKNLSNNDSIGL